MKLKFIDFIEKKFESIKRKFKRKSSENIQVKIDAAPKFEPYFKQGLSAEQVKSRINDGLSNKRKNTVSKSYVEIIFKNIFTVLNVLLISIAIVMMVFGLYGRLFFALILLANIVISLFQDIKAKRLVSKLSLVTNPRATVVRDGAKLDIQYNDIVLSDIIVVKAGSTIPCDSVLVYGSIRVNESFLSGESDDVVKKENDLIYAESYVTSGTAYARVIKVGNANYAFKIQEKARSFSRPSSEILSSLKTIIRVISVGAISFGLAKIISYSVLGKDLMSAVDDITSSMVAMIPSGMYLMTSITLTVGVIILARKRMLVRELYSIEMLARVDVLCIDKTGTITDGNMAVKELITLGETSGQEVEEMIGKILYITKDENLTAKALKDRYATKQIEGDCAAIPFDSAKKFSAASVDRRTYVMGANGFIDIDNQDEVNKVISKYENEGKRVLLIATGKGNIDNNQLPKHLNAVGIVVLVETIKNDARPTLDWFKNNGVDMCIISGDSASSLKAISKEIGFSGSNDVISLYGLTNDEVRDAATKYHIFARVTPDQKKIIIQQLREQGKTVAMVGDGVNDLLALKSADCSIAMASGSDAAKSVAHLVSLDSNFSSLPNVVEEGRRVINNLQRICSIFLVKTMFSFFFVFLYLILAIANYNILYPFTTNNLFVWEFLTIGVAPFFIALEPNKEKITPGFVGNILKDAIPSAFIQIVVTLPPLVAAQIASDIFSSDGVVATSVILFSIMSFIILLQVCFPINKYRAIILSGTAVMMTVIFIIDYFCGSFFLNIQYPLINKSCFLLGGLILIISIPLYFVVAKYFEIFVNKLKKKKYEKGRIN